MLLGLEHRIQMLYYYFSVPPLLFQGIMYEKLHGGFDIEVLIINSSFDLI